MSKYIYVNHIAFKQISNGHKTIEGRINRGLFKNLQNGEIIHFICKKTKEKYSAIILNIKYYNNIYEFLKKENLQNIIHNCKGYNHAIQIYKKYYSNETLNNNSFLAIHFTNN
tara:strand:- start:12 stop:350 length:339 start_codon:yes stop_codon:yes gene_type:complete